MEYAGYGAASGRRGVSEGEEEPARRSEDETLKNHKGRARKLTASSQVL